MFWSLKPPETSITTCREALSVIIIVNSIRVLLVPLQIIPRSKPRYGAIIGHAGPLCVLLTTSAHFLTMLRSVTYP